MRSLLTFYLVLLFCLPVFTAAAFTGTVKFSDHFYAAQKYFYNEAKKKFPRLATDKFYPEIPVRGTATNDDLKKINPLNDLFEARRMIDEEIAKYPEQIYTEAFAYLFAHPALNESPGNKPKFEALESYFFPFLHLFSADRHYTYSPDVKAAPCPLVFCLRDEKKNSISFKLTNVSKKNFSFNLNETSTQAYLTFSGKKPVNLKAGQSATLKFTVNVAQLKQDSTFKVFNFVFADPTQPRVKILVPVILLPSKDLLTLPPHFYDLRFVYSTFFKNIDMYKERTSGPVACGSGNCSGDRSYVLRSSDRSMSSYDFGESGSIQYNVSTSADPAFNLKNNRLRITYNELGSMEGLDRNCPGNIPGSSAPCPADAPNNGRQIYGKRRIEFKLFLPPGRVYALKAAIRFTDLPHQPFANSELSWLQDRKIVLSITDAYNKELARGVNSGTQLNFDKAQISPGTYTVTVYTARESEGKYTPDFELNHLNHGSRSRFDFTLNGSFNLLSFPAPAPAKK